MEFIGILILAVISGFIGKWIAKNKGRDDLEGFLLGFFLAPIGWIIEGLLPSMTIPIARPMPGQKRCPFCAELIQSQAKVCRYCGRDLSEQAAGGGRPHSQPSEGPRFQLVGERLKKTSGLK